MKKVELKNNSRMVTNPAAFKAWLLRACFKSGLLPPSLVEKILKSSSTAVYTPVLKSFLPRQKSKSLLLKQALNSFMCLLFAAVLFGLGTLSCTSKRSGDVENTLRLTLGDDVKTLDPANAYDSVSLTVLPLVLETLYQYHFLKRPVSDKTITPLLAESLPKVSKDQKVLTIAIKKGVYYQSDLAFPAGKRREVKASDFIYAWKRLALPKLASNGLWVFDGKVKGYSEFRSKLVELGPVKAEAHLIESLTSDKKVGFEALDDYTIKIELLSPYPQLIHCFTMGFTAPIPPEVTNTYGQEGLISKMVGTGPFSLKKFIVGSKILLEKNPEFRKETYPEFGDESASKKGLLADAGKSLPFVDAVDFQIMKEEQPRWLKFLNGELDASGIPKDSFSNAIQNLTELTPEMEKKGILLQINETSVIWYLCFNMRDKVLGQNADLRRAIVRAVDRDEMIKLFLNGRAKKAPSMIPPMIDGYTGDNVMIGDYDLAAAKEYLKKAGFPDGKGLSELRFDLRTSSTTGRQQGEFIKLSLEKIGIKVRVEANTFPAYLEKERTGNLQFFFGGWNLDYPDPENVLKLLSSKTHPPGPNAAFYSDPEFDKIYEKVALLPASPERTSLILAAEKKVFGEAVWSMLYYPRVYALSFSWLKNYWPNPMIHNAIKYYRIDIDLRKKMLMQLKR